MGTLKIPCEIWSRVVGYFRPTTQWNLGKRAEFDDRLSYSLEGIKKLIAGEEDEKTDKE